MMKKKGMGTVISILLTAAMLLGGCGSAAETQTPGRGDEEGNRTAGGEGIRC